MFKLAPEPAPIYEACLPECDGCARHGLKGITCWTLRQWNRPYNFAESKPLTRQMITDYLEAWHKREG